MKIHYIAQYGEAEEDRNLAFSPAGVTKIKYIIDVLKNLGYEVVVFSTSSTKNKHFCFYKKKKIKVDAKQSVIYGWTFTSSLLAIRRLNHFLNKLQLILYLLLDVSKDDIVIVYHEIYYIPIIKFIRNVKKIKLIYEVEEIYAAAWNRPIEEVNNEIEKIRFADAYILVNDVMAEKCGLDSKPHIVAYGSYSASETNEKNNFNENIIHVVYAGRIAGEGSDCFLAIDTAEFLGEQYIVHILGTGSDKDMEFMKRRIDSVNRKIGKTVVKYDGFLTGKNYSNFLNKMSIGLCTRVLENEAANYTFPSKLLVYLSYNITPVCKTIDVVLNSKIGSNIIFYENNSPQSVASAICKYQGVKTSSNIVRELNKNFESSLNNLLRGIK